MKLETRRKPKPVTWKALFVILLAIPLIPLHYVGKWIGFIVGDGALYVLSCLCDWAEKKGVQREK